MLTEFEQSVQELARNLLEEYRSTLNDLELRAEYRGLRVLKPGPHDRSSELEVVFYRGNEFADIFEFFVVKDGEPNATLGEIENWLRTELVGLSRRHSA